MRLFRTFGLTLIPALLLCWPAGAAAQSGADAFLGKWDITLPNPSGGPVRACWLDVTREGGELKGRFLPGNASPIPLQQVSIEHGELIFRYQSGRPPDQVSTEGRARVVNGKLEGTIATGKQKPRPWTGVRPPEDALSAEALQALLEVS
jgi:hypothetical protein